MTGKIKESEDRPIDVIQPKEQASEMKRKREKKYRKEGSSETMLSKLLT